eukprot:PhF_6_TR26023/c0_g1_i1/m.36662/K10412/DNAL4; dynein light chain 4, axonemal
MSCQPCKMSRDHISQFATTPLEKLSDMPEDVKSEVRDTVVGAIDKFSDSYETAAKVIKEQMDKKYGPHWHCVIGEGFSFEITYELKHLMYMFHQGRVACVVFKAL